MTEKHISPAIDKTGFDCPSCGIRAVQHWYSTCAIELGKNSTPSLTTKEQAQEFAQKADIPEGVKASLVAHYEKLAEGNVLMHKTGEHHYANKTENLFLAKCDHCNSITVWVYDHLVHPVAGEISPHDDLPYDVKRTFAEASKIVEASPRASAALSRLAIQELCIALECRAKNLNDQLAELVERGLQPDISKMLDAVRVIGNNAVHPGEIDLRDDVQTAKFLLSCINRICQRMITEKLEADALFESLPAGARAQIDRRDKKTV